MAEIQHRVRARLRLRLLERGGAPEFTSEELFDVIESILSRAVAARDRQALVTPELLEQDNWRLETVLRLTSHRRLAGPIILFIKRWLILPVVRFLHDFNVENVHRQQEINELLLACIESLAIEQALLRREVDALRR